jgi:hypothetical protein
MLWQAPQAPEPVRLFPLVKFVFGFACGSGQEAEQANGID